METTNHAALAPTNVHAVSATGSNLQMTAAKVRRPKLPSAAPAESSAAAPNLVAEVAARP